MFWGANCSTLGNDRKLLLIVLIGRDSETTEANPHRDLVFATKNNKGQTAHWRDHGGSGDLKGAKGSTVLIRSATSITNRNAHTE